jgi:hypothetical protein
VNRMSLPSTCPACGGIVRLTFEDWKPGTVPCEARWTCLHCLTGVRLAAVGRIVAVDKIPDQEPG